MENQQHAQPPPQYHPLSRFWKNWPFHNLIAHPVSELLHWVRLGDLGNRLHDATVPVHEPEEEGRG